MATNPLMDNITEESDHYASHLSDVNEDNDVIATEDIVTEKGILLAKKGTRVDARMAGRLIQHRLQKPLERQVMIKDSLTGAICHEHLIALLKIYPDLMQIHSRMNFGSEIEKLMIGRALHPILTQKLTVLHHQSPDLYQKAIFCAWFSAMIAFRLELSGKDVETAYFAGLLHDIGYMHIDPAILNKKGKLTPEEWRALQSHVLIGELLLKNIPGLPENVPRAILEHHERCDATGYPVGKNDENLLLVGQIVGIADTLESIRMKQFPHKGRNMRDAMAYLQLNPTTYFYDVYRTVVDILKASALEPTPVQADNGNKAYIERLTERTLIINYASHLLGQTITYIRKQKQSKSQKKIIRIETHVIGMLTTSGIGRGDIVTWQESLSNDFNEEQLTSLNDIELMQNELTWQISNAQKALEAYIEIQKGKPSNTLSDIAGISAELYSSITALQK